MRDRCCAARLPVQTGLPWSRRLPGEPPGSPASNQVNPGFHRVAGPRHRFIVTSMTSLRPAQAPAGLARSCLAGQGATSLGFGAAPRTSAACATFLWLIHAPRLSGGAGVPLNHRQARIHRDNRRVPPPDVTPVMPCDDCDERGQAEAVTRSSPPLSSAGGQAECWKSWHVPLSRGMCATTPARPSPLRVRAPAG